MRLGILLADKNNPVMRKHFGPYSEMFVQLLDTVSESIQYSIYRVTEFEYPDRTDDCDAYLITGSASGAYEDDPWIKTLIEFVRSLDQAEKKMVGICFGHQLIAVALDGRVEKSERGWGVGVQKYAVENPPSWMDSSASAVQLLCMHQDQVIELPTAAENYVSNAHCEFAGFSIGAHVYTMQSHPEFTKPYAECLMTMREDRLGDRFEPAMKSLSQDTDQALAARWILNFLNT